MDKFILGKYVPFNTIIHRLDPRAKVLSLIFLMAAVFISFNSWALTFTMSIINLILIFVLMIISKVKLKDLIYQLKSMWLLVIILLTINIFVPPQNSIHVLVNQNGITIYIESFLQSAKIIMRLLEMLGLAMILTATTKPQELTNAFSFFMKPLKKVKFPVEEVAMTISIALRFIPTLLEETNRIYKAQASRGVDFRLGGIKTKIKGVISLIVPLFVSSFIMSDELAFALEARGYNPRANCTKYHILSWKFKDTIVILLSLLFMSGFIVLAVTRYDFIKVLLPSFY